MSITAPTYCNREQVKNALDVAEGVGANQAMDRVIESARETIDGATRRSFAPLLATRYFPWPAEATPTPWRLWLDGAELISVTTLTSGGVAVTAPDYLLEPANYGPPYRSIEMDLDGAGSFAPAGSHQRSIVVTGLFGYTDVAETVGTLASDNAATVGLAPVITWTNLSSVGVGSLLQVDSERMLVTGRTMVDTTQNVGGSGLGSSNSSVSLTVTSGAAFSIGEVLLVESERMRVDDIAGNVLTVKRAFDGSVLAAHTAGVVIYALTGLVVARAAQGSTLAAHLSGATVTRWVPPPLIRDWALGLSLTMFLQEHAGYARTAGSGEGEREVSGKGLASVERQALERHGRQLITRAV